MNQHERYKKLTTGLGGELRNLAQSMLRDADMLPGRRALRVQIAEILPDDAMAPVRDALEKKLIELARAAQDREVRFELRGRADNFVLDVAERLEAADRIAEPAPEPTAEEIKAAADGVEDEWAARTRREVDGWFKTPEQRVAELERELRARS